MHEQQKQQQQYSTIDLINDIKIIQGDGKLWYLGV